VRVSEVVGREEQLVGEAVRAEVAEVAEAVGRC
jgi:hypothetical protein